MMLLDLFLFRVENWMMRVFMGLELLHPAGSFRVMLGMMRLVDRVRWLVTIAMCLDVLITVPQMLRLNGVMCMSVLTVRVSCMVNSRMSMMTSWTMFSGMVRCYLVTMIRTFLSRGGGGRRCGSFCRSGSSLVMLLISLLVACRLFFPVVLVLLVAVFKVMVNVRMCSLPLHFELIRVLNIFVGHFLVHIESCPSERISFALVLSSRVQMVGCLMVMMPFILFIVN